MGSMRWLLLVGALVLAIVVKVMSSSGGHGNVRVSGRDDAERVAMIAHGDRVDLGDHIAAGGRTIVEFTAEW